VNFTTIKELEERLKLAKQIDQWEHQLQKQAYDQGWLKKCAKDMDLEVDDDL
jgi:hypothetical protein